MSGDVQLYTQTAASTAFWPLRQWSDGVLAGMECAECSSGVLLVTDGAERSFTISELTARVEEHIPQCRRSR